MNVFQRQMFANGDEVVNVDRLIQYYTAQGYNPVEVTKFIKGEFPAIETATVLDKMREYKELFPVDAQRMPPTGTMDDIRRIDPNSVQFDDGSSVDMSGLISNIRQGEVSAEKVLALLNAPNAKLGSNLQQEVVSYLNKNLPGYSDFIVGEPGEFTDQRKFGIGSLEKEKQASMPFNLRSLARITAGVGAEETREGIEKLADFFGSETIGDMFRAEKYDGDPDAFIRRGGRTEPAFRDMVSGLNDPDQSMFKGAKDTITGLLENLNVDTTQFSDFLGKDPSDMILETDTVQRKRFEDAQIQDDINNVSTEARNGGQPEVNNQEVPVIEVEDGGGEDDGEGVNQDETLGTGNDEKPVITDGEATKRNFGEFIQSPDFIRFARNLGKGLATTGQIGQGIALGAAGAAEEKYAEEVADRETLAEILTEQAKKGGMDVTDRTKILKVQQDMNQSVRDYNNAVAAQELAQSVLDFADGNADLASFASKIGATVADVKTGFTGELDDPSKLSDTRRAQIALEILTNRNIKEILGESGRTISNIDRDIAKRVVGSLDNLKLDSVAAIKLKLDDNIGSIIQKRNEAQRNIKASVGALAPLGIQFDDEIVKIFRGELGQTGIPGSYMSGSNPYPNIIFLDKSKT